MRPSYPYPAWFTQARGLMKPAFPAALSLTKYDAERGYVALLVLVTMLSGQARQAEAVRPYAILSTP